MPRFRVRFFGICTGEIKYDIYAEDSHSAVAEGKEKLRNDYPLVFDRMMFTGVTQLDENSTEVQDAEG